MVAHDPNSLATDFIDSWHFRNRDIRTTVQASVQGTAERLLAAAGGDEATARLARAVFKEIAMLRADLEETRYVDPGD